MAHKPRRFKKGGGAYAAFDESKHVRAAGGKFGSKPGQAKSSAVNPTKLVHKVADSMPGASKADVLAALDKMGVHKATASKQYWLWQKAKVKASVPDIAGLKPAEARVKLQNAAAKAIGVKSAPPVVDPTVADPGNFKTGNINEVKNKLKGGQSVKHPNGQTYFKDKGGAIHAKKGHGDGDLHALEDNPAGKFVVKGGKVVPHEAKPTPIPEPKKVEPPKPEPAPAPKPARTPVDANTDTKGWTKVSGKMGSNEGGVYKAPDGSQYYVKTNQLADRAENEVLANRIYEKLGIQTLKPKLITVDGKPAIASRMQALTKFDVHNADHLAQARQQFGSHVFVANWDATGLNHDNIAMVGGKMVALDAGGSMRFRAQGKPKLFAHDNVNEFDTLRSASVNPAAAKVFGGMSQQEIAQSVKPVLALTDKDIDDVVNGVIKDPKLAKTYADTLKGRRDALGKRVEKFMGGLGKPPVVANVVKPPELPDLAKVGPVKYVHALAGSMPNASKQQVIDAAVAGGVHPSTASTQFYKWKKAQASVAPQSIAKASPEPTHLAAKSPNEMTDDELIAALNSYEPKTGNWSAHGPWGKLPGVQATEAGKPLLTSAVKYNDHLKALGQYNKSKFPQLKAVRDAAGVTYNHTSAAVLSYTGSGSDGINGSLRAVKGDASKLGPYGVANHVKEIDDLIAQSSFKTDVIMYRGVGSGGKTWNGSPPPPELDDHGFISTSFNPSISKAFSDGKTLFRVKVPKGFPGLNVGIGAPSSADEALRGEAEVLLPRGTTFKVVGRTAGGAFDGKMDMVDLIPVLPKGYKAG